MEQPLIKRKLGATGEEVTVLGFGTAPIGLSGYQNKDFSQTVSEPESIKALEAAIYHGITFFDTAPAYANKNVTNGWSTDRASERMLGKAMEGKDRSKLFVATKNMHDRMDSKGIRQSIEESLRLLKLDYVDLFQVHGIIARPFRADNWRDFANDEVLRTFEDLRKEGKTRFIGISGYRECGLSAAIESGLFQVVMPQFNFFYRSAEWELVKLADQYGVAVIPMRPLTGGVMDVFIRQMGIELHAEDAYRAALKYLLQFDCVSCLPIGMRTVSEVEKNIKMINSLA